MICPPGLILWEGPSPLDGAPIVAIVTFESVNDKTGNMVQVWILRQDIHPWEAIVSGNDASICGNCPHRGIIVDGRNVQRSCYVAVEKAPSNVWKSYKRGKYVEYDSFRSVYFDNRKIRWGAYGDPALIPVDIVAFLSRHCAKSDDPGHTGYTHLWRRPEYQWAKAYFDASCDNIPDYWDAVLTGWTPFLVLPPGVDPPAGLRMCPAVKKTAQDERPVQCIDCLACHGSTLTPATSGKLPVGRWIRAHGRGAKHVKA